ncbi:B12-binding domain-containing protein [Dankookia sp. GCM10030260]|uniref:cobalamin B12-binding domain-containing protein n=1 Tax=Dankookia sp. GCM10030260 TaxID=3273390 RepID=UPI003610B7A6
MGLAEAPARWITPEPDERTTQRHSLARAIEDTVLPRLLLTRGTASARPDLDALFGAVPTAADVDRLCLLLVVDDHVAALALVEAQRDRGVTLPHIYLDLLAPAARWLGAAWESDRCDFSTVTLGLMRLQHMVRDYDDSLTRDVRPQSRIRRALLVTAPGEQHSFGRDMLAGFFRHAGWDVWDPAPRGATEFATLLRRESFQVIGISAASEDRLDAVAACIRVVRKSVRNRGAGVMVGGPAFIAHPEYVALVGADATAADGQQATLQAERMLSLMAHWD